MPSGLLHDLRTTLRGMRRSLGYTSLVAVILGVGMGAPAAMFGLVNGLLLRPLPYPDADRLVRLYRTQGEKRAWPHAPEQLQALGQLGQSFDGLAAFRPKTYSLNRSGQAPEALAGLEVSSGFFPLLRTHPVRGRLFVPEEDTAGSRAVAVLAESTWRTRFGADPEIIGRTLMLDGEPVTVVGIAPATASRTRLWGSVEVWRPIGLGSQLPHLRGHHVLEAMARLGPGVSVAEAQAEADVLAAQIHADQGRTGLRVLPLARSVLDETSARLVFFAVSLGGVVLLIAWVNAAGLGLARHAARAPGYAVRAALGATRGRLRRLVVLESTLLAIVGGALACGFADTSADLVGRWLIAGPASADPTVSLDARVVAFVGALVVLSALVVGAATAALAPLGGRPASLRLAARTSTRPAWPRFRGGMVIAQLGLALVLLVSSASLLQGLGTMGERDPGWRVDGLVTARLELPVSRYGAAERRVFHRQLEARLGALPGVEASAISWWFPLSSAGPTGYLEVEGRPELTRPEGFQRQAINDVTSSFFATLGLRLREGRVLAPADELAPSDSAKATVVSESLARRFWPGESAIGKRIRKMGESSWTTVVGVVADVRYPAKLSHMLTWFQVYRPLAHQPRESVVISLRTALPPAGIAPALKRAVADLDPGLPVRDVAIARQALERELGHPTAVGWILFAFAVLGSSLAGLGVYALFAGLVVERTREIGVRIALGADATRVARLFIDKSLRLALMGLLLALPLCLAAARLLAAVAPELPAHHPRTVLGLALALLAITFAATWLPARRATAVDPMLALRQE